MATSQERSVVGVLLLGFLSFEHLLACTDEVPPLPLDLAIDPNEGPDMRDTPVIIHGQALAAFIQIDFGNASMSMVDRRMTAEIGSTKLVNVMLMAKNTLTAIVPKGIPRGIYSLTVTDGLMRSVTRNTAYHVRETYCSDLSDPSGMMCAACNGMMGCRCPDQQTCSAVCGDGIIKDDEECDDGNTRPGDGCDGSCQVETGWTCTSTPTNVPSVCHMSSVSRVRETTRIV
jgi:cysteine-rich repeat protein